MRLRILAVGTRMPDWVEAGCREYLKRLPPELNVDIVELPLGQRGKGADIQRAIARDVRQCKKGFGAVHVAVGTAIVLFMAPVAVEGLPHGAFFFAPESLGNDLNRAPGNLSTDLWVLAQSVKIPVLRPAQTT